MSSNSAGDGVELWRGPSVIAGTPIGVVLTHIRGEPLNRKIGNMAQAWVLPLDEEPNDAARSGGDRAVCGDCPQRPANGGGCYVPIYSTAQRVWWAWRRFGSYKPGRMPLLDKSVRIGAWGDPGAVPVEVWDDVRRFADGWTAYTHRWRHLDAAKWASWCMASVDSPLEAFEARERGWRTFRAKAAGMPRLAWEVACPNEARPDVTCERCGLCKGRATAARSIVLDVHGTAVRKAERVVSVRPELAMAGAK